MSAQKLIDRVRVPFLDGHGLLQMPVLVVQLYDGVQAAYVLDLQVGVLCRSVTFDESLNLRIGAKLARAHLQYRFGVYFVVLTFFVRAATLLTVIP